MGEWVGGHLYGHMEPLAGCAAPLWQVQRYALPGTVSAILGPPPNKMGKEFHDKMVCGAPDLPATNKYHFSTMIIAC